MIAIMEKKTYWEKGADINNAFYVHGQHTWTMEMPFYSSLPAVTS